MRNGRVALGWVPRAVVRLLVAAAVAWSCVPAVSFAVDNPDAGVPAYGGRDFGVAVPSVHDENETVLDVAASIPASYSSVDAGYVTPVKDQNPFDTCWAFASISAVESSMLRRGPRLGYTKDTLDLSERHAATSDMHRLYNPYTGEHFYTADAGERDSLSSIGWAYEGVGWTAPRDGEPVFRLYNPFAGDHHYTTSAEERDMLVSAGWNDEGIGWYSRNMEARGKYIPVYRPYNPNATVGSHNYTVSLQERDNLVAAGWIDEGICWYGLNE